MGLNQALGRWSPTHPPVFRLTGRSATGFRMCQIKRPLACAALEPCVPQSMSHENKHTISKHMACIHTMLCSDPRSSRMRWACLRKWWAACKTRNLVLSSTRSWRTLLSSAPTSRGTLGSGPKRVHFKSNQYSKSRLQCNETNVGSSHEDLAKLCPNHS